MKTPFKKTEYKRILTFLHHITPKTSNLREQIQTGLSNIWGYDNTLFWISNNDGSVFDPQLLGIKQNTLYEYKDHFEHLDPLHPKKLLNTIPTEQIFNFTNIHSHEHFYESDYYTQFLRKHGFKDEMAVNFVHNNKLIATLGILRKNNERTFSNEDINRFRAIQQFILQKISDYMQLEQQSVENTLYRNYMDNSNDGYILVNERQHIIYKNEAATELIHKLKGTKNVQTFIKQITNDQQQKAKRQIQLQLLNEQYELTITNSNTIHQQQRHYLLHITKKKNSNTIAAKLIVQKTLTNREADVCQLLIKGYTNKEVAADLFISINTVKKHIQNIYDKLSVRNRSELAKTLLQFDNRLH